jgi:hypothetical protein
MIAGRIPRSDLQTVLKEPRLVRTFDQMQDIVFGSIINLDFPDDTAAAASGLVNVGDMYHNAGAVRIRLT